MRAFAFAPCPRPRQKWFSSAAVSAPAPPPAPTGLLNYAPEIYNITANGSGSVTVFWRNSPFMADGSTAYATPTGLTIYWGATTNEQRPGGAGSTPVSVPSPLSTSHTFTVTTGIRRFAMTATNSNGESDVSAERAVTVT